MYVNLCTRIYEYCSINRYQPETAIDYKFFLGGGGQAKLEGGRLLKILNLEGHDVYFLKANKKKIDTPPSMIPTSIFVYYLSNICTL